MASGLALRISWRSQFRPRSQSEIRICNFIQIGRPLPRRTFRSVPLILPPILFFTSSRPSIATSFRIPTSRHKTLYTTDRAYMKVCTDRGLISRVLYLQQHGSQPAFAHSPSSALQQHGSISHLNLLRHQPHTVPPQPPSFSSVDPHVQISYISSVVPLFHPMF